MKPNEILFILFVAVIVIFAPFGFIWSLNTLFPVLAIEYSLKTWLATIAFMLFIKSPGDKK